MEIITIRRLKQPSLEIEINPKDSILELKHDIEEITGVPVEKQVLIYHGKLVPDNLQVKDFIKYCCLDLFVIN
jgi:hypothetical protein